MDLPLQYLPQYQVVSSRSVAQLTSSTELASEISKQKTQWFPFVLGEGGISCFILFSGGRAGEGAMFEGNATITNQFRNYHSVHRFLSQNRPINDGEHRHALLPGDRCRW